MAKREYTEYTCDRCGAKINDKPFPLTKHCYIHLLRFFMPAWYRYRLYYLCPDCKKSFMKWAKLKNENDDNAE